MRDISGYIRNNTPLKNDGIKILSTETYSESDIGYTPDGIVTWNHGRYDHTGRENASFACHEIGHMIEMFERKPKRLLKDNYGFGIDHTSQIGDNMGATMAEVRTIAYQKLIERAQPEVFNDMPIEDFHYALMSGRRMELSKEDFVGMVVEKMKEASLDDLYGKYDAACEYIKRHR